jgi:hypothetical protein
MLSSCGSSGDAADAGKSVMGVLGAGLGTAPTSRFASAAKEIAMQTARSATWAAFVQSAARAERHLEDVARSGAANAAPRTDACSALSQSSSSETITGSGSGASGSFTCSVACSGSSEVLASNCTMGTGATITATCGGTTYTATKGTFGISLPDFTVGSTSLTSTSLTFSLDLFITGGNFKSSPGSEVKLGMTFNFSALESGATSASNFCNAVTNFSASVDGATVSCNDLANGVTGCG